MRSVYIDTFFPHITHCLPGVGICKKRFLTKSQNGNKYQVPGVRYRWTRIKIISSVSIHRHVSDVGYANKMDEILHKVSEHISGQSSSEPLFISDVFIQSRREGAAQWGGVGTNGVCEFDERTSLWGWGGVWRGVEGGDGGGGGLGREGGEWKGGLEEGGQTLEGAEFLNKTSQLPALWKSQVMSLSCTASILARKSSTKETRLRFTRKIGRTPRVAVLKLTQTVPILRKMKEKSSLDHLSYYCRISEESCTYCTALCERNHNS